MEKRKSTDKKSTKKRNISSIPEYNQSTKSLKADKKKKSTKSKLTDRSEIVTLQARKENITEAALMLNRENEEAATIIAEQDKILRHLEESMKDTNMLIGEIDKVAMKNENEDLPYSFNRQAGRLGEMLDNVAKYSNDLDNLNTLQEENKSLRYKMEIKSINDHDESLNLGTKLNNLKNIITSEISQFSRFCADLGYSIDTSLGSTSLEDVNLPYFFKNVKHLFGHIHRKNEGLKEEVSELENEKRKLIEEVKELKMERGFLNDKSLEREDIERKANEYALREMSRGKVEAAELESRSKLHFQYDK